MSPNIATLYTFQIKCWSICSLKFVINLSEVYILKIYIISRFIISGKRINSMCEEYHTHLNVSALNILETYFQNVGR